MKAWPSICQAILETTEHQNDLLETISHFNLEARYDDYKKTFENKCTDEYTESQIKNKKTISFS